MKLVGLIGHANSGKNSFAEEFHYHSYREYSFAAPVKAACHALFGTAPHHFEDRDTKESKHPFWNKSPREMAQFVGTELVRNNIDKFLPEIGSYFWIERLKLQLLLDHPTKEDVRAVITDCRFQNEVEFILSTGGHIIYLTRPGSDGTVGISNHPSEQFIKEFSELFPESSKVHYVENHGTLDELRIKANVLAASLQY